MTSPKLPKEFKKGLKKIPEDTFAQKFYRPENIVYNLMSTGSGLRITKPIESKEGKIFHIPVNGFQLIVLPDGSVKAREI